MLKKKTNPKPKKQLFNEESKVCLWGGGMKAKAEKEGTTKL